MDERDLFRLYRKERTYEKKVFGVYADNPNLNVASFLQFIERTLEKAKSSYVNKWDKEFPQWLLSCVESSSFDQPAPVETYEYLVKIFALAGAALESYTSINVEKWREGFEIKNKWRDNDE